jgi:hypothetical protein
MAKAGFNLIRMAEFAWARMEPKQGRYDFSIFDETIELLAKQGIKTLLCTPTAAPPRWLTQQHPEVLRVNADGVPLAHGSRQHACHASSEFRKHSRRITQAMALGQSPCEQARADLAAATQEAIVDVLTGKSLMALDSMGLDRLVVAGGVGANRLLRQRLDAACAERGVRVHYPELELCTDNGAMIALAAAMRIQAGLDLPQSDRRFDVKPRWPLDSMALTTV